MVSKKTAKNAKLTYADRVLGAISQVQKEHKRHSIHLATLRAQVKKNAQAKMDRLGPHWSKWVGKAEDDGILQASDDTGNVSLTPNGKKAISAARKSLGLPDVSDNSSATMDDLVWKRVSQQRKLSAMKHHELETIIGESVSAMSKTGRYRTSLLKSKPTSKMTKVEELQSLIATTQGANTSTLTDIDDDGTERLKVLLKDREIEIETLRRELEKTRIEQDGRGETANRFVTPPPQRTSRYVTPPQTTRNRDKSLPTLRVASHSGSFILPVNNQTMPAPNTPNIDFEMNDYLVDNNAEAQMEPMEGILEDTQQGTNDVIAGLATPLSTPPPPALSNEQHLVPYDTQMPALEAILQALRAEMREMEASLSTKNTEISGFQRTISTLQQESESEVKCLKESLHQAETIISKHKNQETAISSDIAAERSRADSLEASVHIHLRTISGLELQIKGLETETEGLSRSLLGAKEHNESLTQLLALASQNVDNFQTQLMQNDITIEELRTSLSDSQTEVKILHERITSTVAENKQCVAKLESEITSAKTTVLDLQKQVNELTIKLTTADECNRQINEECEQQKVDIITLRGSLSEEQNRSNILDEKLEKEMMVGKGLEEEVLALRSSKAADELTIKELHSVFTELRDSQMKTLTEIENKIVLAHPSTVPIRGNMFITSTSA
ncbi:hypothetical protein BDQ17DRAFT_1421512 [Cyathus striatus]|nr:hypothetical protein BDQ17DRAFT_1421512 [Cyathus striatus]